MIYNEGYADTLGWYFAAEPKSSPVGIPVKFTGVPTSGDTLATIPATQLTTQFGPPKPLTFSAGFAAGRDSADMTPVTFTNTDPAPVDVDGFLCHTGTRLLFSYDFSARTIQPGETAQFSYIARAPALDPVVGLRQEHPTSFSVDICGVGVTPRTGPCLLVAITGSFSNALGLVQDLDGTGTDADMTGIPFGQSCYTNCAGTPAWPADGSIVGRFSASQIVLVFGQPFSSTDYAVGNRCSVVGASRQTLTSFGWREIFQGYFVGGSKISAPTVRVLLDETTVEGSAAAAFTGTTTVSDVTTVNVTDDTNYPFSDLTGSGDVIGLGSGANIELGKDAEVFTTIGPP